MLAKMSRQNFEEVGVLRTKKKKRAKRMPPCCPKRGCFFFPRAKIKQAHLEAYFTVSPILSATQAEMPKSSTCKSPAVELRSLIAFSIRGDVNKRF